MRADERIRSFGLVGNYGNLNLGDEATLASVVEVLHRLHPGARIVAFSFDPADTRRRHGVEARPGGRDSWAAEISGGGTRRATRHADGPTVGAPPSQLSSLAAGALRRAMGLFGPLKELLLEIAFTGASFSSLRDIDVLVVSGGGQIADNFGGAFGYPYSLLRWCGLAKLQGKEVLFLNVGVSRLEFGLSRWFVRRALGLADRRSFRDRSSKKLAEDLGAREDDPVGPDLAFRLDLPPAPAEAPNRPASRPVVAINAFPHYDVRYWPQDQPLVYRKYVDILSRFALWLFDEGYDVWLFPTQLRADSWVIADVRKALHAVDPVRTEQRLLDWSAPDVTSLMQRLANVEAVVATRFHGLILGFMVGRAAVAISNQTKMTDLMRDVGQEEFLLTIDELELAALIERFRQLMRRRERVEAEIAATVAAYREALADECERLLGPASGPGGGKP